MMQYDIQGKVPVTPNVLRTSLLITAMQNTHLLSICRDAAQVS